MSATLVNLATYRKPPGCPRCGAVDHEVEFAGWWWGTCYARRLKWKITVTTASDTDSAIKYLANFWPADMRHGAGPDAA